MHETCSNNVIESHVPETVMNMEVDFNNGSCNEAQVMTQPNQRRPGTLDSNKCSEKDEVARLEPMEVRSENQHGIGTRESNKYKDQGACACLEPTKMRSKNVKHETRQFDNVGVGNVKEIFTTDNMCASNKTKEQRAVVYVVLMEERSVEE